MIIAVSAGIIEDSASRSRSVSAPRTPPPSWTKCSKRARRLSTNPKSPFGSHSTAPSQSRGNERGSDAAHLEGVLAPRDTLPDSALFPAQSDGVAPALGLGEEERGHGCGGRRPLLSAHHRLRRR